MNFRLLNMHGKIAKVTPERRNTHDAETEREKKSNRRQERRKE